MKNLKKKELKLKKRIRKFKDFKTTFKKKGEDTEKIEKKGKKAKSGNTKTRKIERM